VYVSGAGLVGLAQDLVGFTQDLAGAAISSEPSSPSPVSVILSKVPARTSPTSTASERSAMEPFLTSAVGITA
jgi:hypothetical protein